MDQSKVFLIILGMAAVTFLPRVLPIWLLASRKLPDVVITWLRYVPAAVLAAMLLPSVLLQNGQPAISVQNLYLAAFFPTLLTAWKTRSLFTSVIVGMGLVALARLWMG